MFQDIEPHEFNGTFISYKEMNNNDYFLIFKDNRILLKKEEDSWTLPSAIDLELNDVQKEAIYLFSIDQRACFLIRHSVNISPGFSFEDMLSVRNLASKDIVWVSSVGYHLYTWYQANQFCGKCGSKTTSKSDERALVCNSCNSTIYPRISPAIIVAITCKDKILLAKGKHYKRNFYSLVAGYVDIGESLEKTLAREVKEEVGIDVKNIRYYKSQPWPFSGSLMIGFFAEADDQQPIKIDEKEIAEAGWFQKDALPPHSTAFSIAGELIEVFKNKE